MLPSGEMFRVVYPNRLRSGSGLRYVRGTRATLARTAGGYVLAKSKVAAAAIVAVSALLITAGGSTAVAGAAQQTPTPTASQPAATPDPDDPCAPGQAGVVYGTEGNDVLNGTNGNDVICGLGGNDTINGGNGDDVIDGGAGNDTIAGGNGLDTLYGGDGNDAISGGNDNDAIYGGGGNDTLNGDNGNDLVSGEDGADTIRGGNGDDTLDGGNGADNLGGDNGNDRIFGGPGDDVADGALGDDQINGAEGTDTLTGGLGTDVCTEGEKVTSCESTTNPAADSSFPTQLTPAPEPAGKVTFEGGPGLDGLKIVVNSTGGLGPNDITVKPDRQASIGISSVSASPAYDVTLANPAAMTSAEVTVPYDPDQVHSDFDATDLRLASFRRTEGLWIPVTGDVNVDTTAHTVTMTVKHFSLIAVVQEARGGFWDSKALTEMFGKTPVPCVPPGSAGSHAGLDVAFVIDTSGSMYDNDPSGLRVTAAKSFLARLRPGDRAAVIDFDDWARTVIGLTDVAKSDDRDSISAALDQTNDANGGTDIGAAVSEATSLLSAGGSNRLRIAILLSDGQSYYDDNLTSAAAAAGVSFSTVALGYGADASLLNSIAAGTGGHAFTADSATDLAALYDELADTIIDDNTDTDGDGLTDCEETTGLFAPSMVYLPDLRINYPSKDFGAFSFTNPKSLDSDGDGTPDDKEVVRRNFRDNPEFANAFQVMVDAGRSTYFELVTGRPDKADTDNDGLPDPVWPRLTEVCGSEPSGTSPFDWDSDLDSVSDYVECFNGDDPLHPDTKSYGVPGLAPYSLFTPDRYDLEANPVVPILIDERGYISATNRAVYYDEDYNCVNSFGSTGCDALLAWAKQQPDDGWLCLWGHGSCPTDASQIRDKIKEIVESQKVFASDGTLRSEYVGTYSSVLCQQDFSGTGQCAISGMVAAAALVAKKLEAPELGRGAANTLSQRVGTAPKMDPAAIGRIAAAVAVSTTLYRESQVSSDAERRDRVTRAVRACSQTAVLLILPYRGTAHPCRVNPIFLPGETDAGGAARNDAAAIAADPSKLLLQYAPAAERLPVVQAALIADGKPSSNPRQWYQQYDPCKKYSAPYACDEYPFFASTRSGPPVGGAGSRLAVVLGSENTAEGNAYSAFTRSCPPVSSTPRKPFLVVPLVGPAAAPTDWVCPR